MRDDAFVLGVNYWPRRKAMGWWADCDEDEVRAEFSVIAGLGLDVVRVFLLWDDWQPTPGTVSEACLTNLGRVLDTAAELGLGLDVTFFTGHMSGPNWAPGRLLRAGQRAPGPAPRTVISGGRRVVLAYRNPFHDPEALLAAETLLRAVVGPFRDHPGVWMWNLGNEPNLFAWPASPGEGRAWVRRMASVVRELDPRHPVTCGLHVESLLQDNGLRVSDVFAETDVAVMHGYPMYADWAKGPLDPDYVPFTCALTTALSGKPTLMEEWGGCTAAPGEPSHVMRWRFGGAERTQFMASEDDLADYVAALWERPPCDEAQHVRFFGLVRPDGSLKPHAEALRALAQTHPRVRPAARRFDLDVSPGAYYADPAGHARRLSAAFLADAENP